MMVYIDSHGRLLTRIYGTRNIHLNNVYVNLLFSFSISLFISKSSILCLMNVILFVLNREKTPQTSNASHRTSSDQGQNLLSGSNASLKDDVAGRLVFKYVVLCVSFLCK